MHEYLNEFLLIALAHFFAVASPGPDFAIILKQSVNYGRANALWTSLGVGLGILVHVSYCLLGVALILSQSPSAFMVMKYLAGIYLGYLGFQALQTKPANKHMLIDEFAQQTEPLIHAFQRGFLVNALNPKATLFFLSLFTLVISPTTPTSVQAIYGVYMALATWLWFSGLSCILTQANVRRFFQNTGHWFDRSIGIILITLAVSIVL